MDHHWLERKIAQTAIEPAVQDQSAMKEDSNLYSKVLYILSYDQQWHWNDYINKAPSMPLGQRIDTATGIIIHSTDQTYTT